MLRRLFSSRNSRRPRAFRPLMRMETLETRAVMAATPLGTVLNLIGTTDPLSVVDSSSPAVDISDSGEAVVAFRGRSTGIRSAGDDVEIFARRVAAAGTLTGDIISINQITRGEQSLPDVARAENGVFLVVWSGRGAGDKEGIFARRFNANGTAAGDEIRINGTRGGTQTRPAVAMAPDGRAVIVWDGAGTGDSDGIFFRRLTRTGLLDGGEIKVNTTTAGQQAYADVEMAADGQFVVTWSHRAADANDWEILAQRFSANGTPQGSEIAVNTTQTNNQIHPSVSVADDGEFVVGWSSLAQDGDSWGAFAQRFAAAGTKIGTETRLNQTTAGEQRDVRLAISAGGEFLASWNQRGSSAPGQQLIARAFTGDTTADGGELTVATTSASVTPRGSLPAGIALGPDGNAFVVFNGLTTSALSNLSAQRLEIEVSPVQNVAPQIQDVANQSIKVGDTLSVVVTATDANRRDNLTFRLVPNIRHTGATITAIDNRSARVTWTPTAADRNPQAVPFRVEVDDNGSPQLGDAIDFLITVANAVPVVDVNGSATGTNGTAVLPDAATEVAITSSTLTLTDRDHTQMASATITIKGILDGADEELLVDVSGTVISKSYNATTGALFLTGVDSISNYQRVLRTLRYENTATPRSGSQRRIEILVNDGLGASDIAEVNVSFGSANTAPTLPVLANVTVRAGSPLVIPLDAEDANGDTITFTATSSNTSLLTPEVLTGNRSARMTVANFGEMVFELFEGLAPRATSRIIQLANSDFYDGIIFHRVVNDFVIQAGDPTGTGSGGSSFPDFDDQFSLDLQHNSTGLLSMAKTTDDTNDSQFFITEGPQRHLDYNHTIFGALVEGESVRQAISNTPVQNSRPVTPVTIQNVEIFTDNENGVLLLKAPQGQTGTTTVSVTASDGRGGQINRQFTVTVIADDGANSNSPPFLADIPQIVTTANQPQTITLQGKDVEGDPIFFLDQAALQSRGLAVPVQAPANLSYVVNPTTGQLTVTPSNNITGTFRITVAAASSLTGLTTNSPLDYQVIEVVVNNAV